MKYFGVIILMMLFAGGVLAAETIGIHVRPLDAAGAVQPNVIFPYIFVFANDTACTEAELTVGVSITTDNYGIGFVELDISGLNYPPQYLCENRSGTLRTVHNISTGLFNELYVLGNITAEGNITLDSTITFENGELIDNIENAWIRITGGLNVTDDIYANDGHFDYLNFSFLVSNFGGGIDATGDPWYLSGVNFQVEDNITADNITVSGNITVGGNVSASYFFGNGSQLTGIATADIWVNETGDTMTGNLTIDAINPGFTLRYNVPPVETSTIELNSQGDLILDATGGDIRIDASQLWLYDAVGDSPSLAIEDADLKTFSIQKYITDYTQFWSDDTEIRIQLDNDLDDYLIINTTSDQTTLRWAGQSGRITADGGDIDFDDENLITTGSLTVGAGAGTVDCDAPLNMIFGPGAGNSLGAGAVENVAIGKDALFDNVAGDYNIAIGRNALHEALGGNNVGIGRDAGYSTTGSYNFAIGFQTMFYTSTGQYNTAIGFSAMTYNKVGNQNTAIGGYAGRGAFGQSHTGNTHIGYSAGFNSRGSRNTCIGVNSCVFLTTGSENIYIGQAHAGNHPTSNNRLNIGNVIFSTGVGIGDTIGTGYCGVKIENPIADWHVNGTLLIEENATFDQWVNITGDLNVSSEIFAMNLPTGTPVAGDMYVCWNATDGSLFLNETGC